LIILTRVSADAGMRRFIEQRLQPVVRPLGFRTAEFAWSRYAQWLAGAHRMELVERRPVPPLGHFSLVRIRKTAMAVAADLRRLKFAWLRRPCTSCDISMMSHRYIESL